METGRKKVRLGELLVKVFQALRIEVNQEMEALKEMKSVRRRICARIPRAFRWSL